MRAALVLWFALLAPLAGAAFEGHDVHVTWSSPGRVVEGGRLVLSGEDADAMRTAADLDSDGRVYAAEAQEFLDAFEKVMAEPDEGDVFTVDGKAPTSVVAVVSSVSGLTGIVEGDQDVGMTLAITRKFDVKPAMGHKVFESHEPDEDEEDSTFSDPSGELAMRLYAPPGYEITSYEGFPGASLSEDKTELTFVEADDTGGNTRELVFALKETGSDGNESPAVGALMVLALLALAWARKGGL